MLTPDLLPPRFGMRVEVHHTYPPGWTEDEKDQHRYDDCPCAPEMVQVFSTCGHEHGYRWMVKHKRIPKTEST